MVEEVVVEEELGLVSLVFRNLPAISIRGSSLSDESSTVGAGAAGVFCACEEGVSVAALLCCALRIATVFFWRSVLATAAAATAAAAFRGFFVRLGRMSSLTQDWVELSDPCRFRLPAFGRVFGLSRSPLAAAVGVGMFEAIAAACFKVFFSLSAAGESIDGLCRGGSSGLSSLLDARVLIRCSPDSGCRGISIDNGE